MKKKQKSSSNPSISIHAFRLIYFKKLFFFFTNYLTIIKTTKGNKKHNKIASNYFIITNKHKALNQLKQSSYKYPLTEQHKNYVHICKKCYK